MDSPNIEVLGLGAPIADHILRVTDEFLKTVEGEKGGSQSIDHLTLVNILKRAEQQAASTPGGSAANTIVGLNALGNRTALAGMIGRDEMGRLYRERLTQRGIFPLLTECEGEATAQVLSLVTGDGQRTMRCFLGASSLFNSSHLEQRYFEGVRLLHCEGYALYNGDGDLVREAMVMAKRAGAQVSFDLASFEVVRRYEGVIRELLENYVDIVFCNEDEANVINPGASAEDTALMLASLCKVSVVTLGAKGCIACTGTQKMHCPTSPVKCIDTTGAGDIFASGFLHCYLKGCSLRECCRVGHLLGRSILQFLGAQLPDSAWEEILAEINQGTEVANRGFLNPFKHVKPVKQTA
jgi:sugar/nucleoside kinase (ribokinase family)